MIVELRVARERVLVPRLSPKSKGGEGRGKPNLLRSCVRKTASFDTCEGSWYSASVSNAETQD
jgi:hypothetical protein